MKSWRDRERDGIQFSGGVALVAAKERMHAGRSDEEFAGVFQVGKVQAGSATEHKIRRASPRQVHRARSTASSSPPSADAKRSRASRTGRTSGSNQCGGTEAGEPGPTTMTADSSTVG